MKNLPDPADIIFGTMMYTAGQMREYAATCKDSSQVQPQGDSLLRTIADWRDEKMDWMREEVVRLCARIKELEASSQESVKKWTWDEVREYTKERVAAHMREIAASRQEPAIKDSLTTQTASPAATVPDERVAFDRWFNEDLTYTESILDRNQMWLAWQARAALASPKVPDAKQEPKYGCDEKSYAQGWNDCRDEMIAAAQQKEKE